MRANPIAVGADDLVMQALKQKTYKPLKPISVSLVNQKNQLIGLFCLREFLQVVLA